MVELYRRPHSRFWYFDVMVGGKRKRRSTKRTKKAEAEQVALAEAKQALDAEQLGVRRELTLREALFKLYLPGMINAASYVNLKRSCEYLCGDREGIEGLADGGETKFHRITYTDLDHYRARRLAQGMSPQSVDHEIKCVSAAYHKVLKDRTLRAPEALQFPMARPKGKPRYLTEDEEKALLADLHPDRKIKMRGRMTTFSDPLARVQKQRQDNYDLTIMLLDTGARYGEIAKLTWAMVDVQDFSWVHIYRSKVQNEGVLSTTARMREVLRRRWAGRGDSAYVFPGYRLDTKEDMPRRVTHAIRRSMERVGINSPQNVARFGRRDVRSFRDTFASKLRRGDPDRGIPGMSLDRLQKLLGHASPVQTQKYADLAVTAASEEAVAALDQLNA